MKKNRLVISDAAAADIVEQADWYLMKSGCALAEQWENAVTSARRRDTLQISFARTPRFEARVNILGFRKHLLFYTFDSEQVCIVRVVHGARDLEQMF